LTAPHTTGLLLFAHGARDPRWAAPFEAVAAQVRSSQPGLQVRLAFLEFMTPNLPDAGAELAAAGCTHIAVVPLFLGAGGHVRKDLPLQLHPAVGEVTSVVQAMAAVAIQAVQIQTP
jgi:sirohydrochlorin cobaltochelatase